jgi:hypothetical protein
VPTDDQPDEQRGIGFVWLHPIHLQQSFEHATSRRLRI